VAVYESLIPSIANRTVRYLGFFSKIDRGEGWDVAELPHAKGAKTAKLKIQKRGKYGDKNLITIGLPISDDRGLARFFLGVARGGRHRLGLGPGIRPRVRIARRGRRRGRGRQIGPQ
jgi:hypothetical protein